MATVRWIGAASPITQVTRLVPANVSIGDVFKGYMGGTSTGYEVTYTATAATVASVVTGFAAAVSASTHPAWQEVTAQDSTTHVTLTAATAGYPFIVATTVTLVSTSTGTFGTTHVTTAAGPTWFNDPDNWSGGAAPTTSDTVDLSGLQGVITDGLTIATTLAQIDVRADVTKNIGRPDWNANGYAEYRTKDLTIGAAVVNVYGTGNRFRLNTGSGACTLNIYGSGSPAEPNTKTIQWIGTNTGNVVNVVKGSFAAAQRAEEAAAINTLRMSWKTNQKGDADVYLGPGVTTLTTIVKSGGTLTLNSTFSTLTQTGGETYHDGTGAGGTVNVLGGTLYPRTSGTYAVVVAGSGGTLDCRQDIRSRTWTATTLRDGAVYLDPDKTVTHTTGITVQGDVKIDWGKSYSVNRTA